jgi:hypothetical protein
MPASRLCHPRAVPLPLRDSRYSVAAVTLRIDLEMTPGARDSLRPSRPYPAAQPTWDPAPIISGSDFM